MVMGDRFLVDWPAGGAELEILSKPHQAVKQQARIAVKRALVHDLTVNTAAPPCAAANRLA